LKINRIMPFCNLFMERPSYLCYCIDSSVCHFEFSNVMLARISDEVGTLGTVLLSVYSGTRLPIFIEIGSYLTDTEQKISWHVFLLRHGVE